jgi:hypothetical protein
MQLLPTYVGCKLPYELPTSPSYDTEEVSVRESASTFTDVPAPIPVFVVPRSNDYKFRKVEDGCVDIYFYDWLY